MIPFQRKFNNSEELCRHIQKIKKDDDKILLRFSRGKDAVGSLLQLLNFFDRSDIVCVHFSLIPGLSFVTESLEYFENFFKIKIHDFLHFSTLRFYAEGLFCDLSTIYKLEDRGFYDIPVNRQDYDTYILKKLGLSSQIAASGVRISDSLLRRHTITKNGSLTPNKNGCVFYPIYDFTNARLRDMLKKSGVRLPVDYLLFNRSFDGLQWGFVNPLKREKPHDYERVKMFFPLIEVENLRVKNYGN